jgi:hypothetical protein
MGYSLIDISSSSALQIQNYNTLLQTISLRANPMNIKVDMAGNQNMQDYDFGDNFGGHQNVWFLSFVVEQLEVFGNKSGPIGGLLQDCHQVPVITNLMESAPIHPAVFDTQNSNTKNLYFNIQDL